MKQSDVDYVNYARKTIKNKIKGLRKEIQALEESLERIEKNAVDNCDHILPNGKSACEGFEYASCSICFAFDVQPIKR